MAIDTSGINHIILDLGGVVVDLDPGQTLDRFKSLGFTGFENVEQVMAAYPFFGDYELGVLSTREFLASVQEITGKEISHGDIVRAWNSMILDPREDIFRMLRALKLRFQLYLLSNTSELHILSLNERLDNQLGIHGLEEVFDKVYYSYTLGMHKPDLEIFEFVLQDRGMKPSETLYIDDSRIHIDSASRLGIRGYHMKPTERLTGVLQI